MKQWLKQYAAGYMIRPTVYMAFKRAIYALTLTLLWNWFVRDKAGFPVYGTHALVLPGVFFLAMAWFNYLWLDGVRSPITIKGLGRLAQLQQMFKKRQSASYGAISDYIDSSVVAFDQLTEDERRACSLMANLICALLFLAWSVA